VFSINPEHQLLLFPVRTDCIERRIGRGNQSAVIATEAMYHAHNVLLDLLRRSLRINILNIHDIEEGYLPPEIIGEKINTGLIRGIQLQCINANGDEIGDDPANVATGVENKVHSKIMCL